jgi:hypothetical protein
MVIYLKATAAIIVNGYQNTRQIADVNLSLAASADITE